MCYKFLSENSEKCYILPCRHIFHSKCAQVCLVTPFDFHHCPVCMQVTQKIQPITKLQNLDYEAGQVYLKGQGKNMKLKLVYY